MKTKWIFAGHKNYDKYGFMQEYQISQIFCPHDHICLNTITD